MQFKNIAVLSTAGVIAAIAIGAGGAAVATNLIGSQEIRDNSVRSIDVKDGSLRTDDLKPSTVKALKGEDGYVVAGAGYAGWPTDNPHHDLWAANSWGQTVQKCKDGEVAVGGGFSSFGGYNGDNSRDLGGMNDVRITVSAPYINSDADYVPVSESDSRFAPNQWIVRGFNAGDEPVDVRAWVTCTKVG